MNHQPCRCFIGIALTCLGLWLLFDSVRVTSGYGWFSGYMRGWWSTTTSTGIIFVPFILGVIAIFYDFNARWAYWLTGLGILVVLLEMLSRIHFEFNIKSSHMLLMLALFAAGLGLCLRGYFKHAKKQKVRESIIAPALPGASSLSGRRFQGNWLGFFFCGGR